MGSALTARTSSPPFRRCGSPLLSPWLRRSIWRCRSPQRYRWPGPYWVLWFASPAIAWWISLPLTRRAAKLTADQTRFLQKISRKTWAFFETFVGPEDHWLPPDNYQEHPVARVAHRTSPTNMGLALLANLAAYDFGYISAGRLVERTGNALHTMAALERYRGHFYNWYDTQSLQPLLPKYISTVDSGNLAGHLLTLRAGLVALPDQQILEGRWFDGLGHTLRIIADTAAGAALGPAGATSAGPGRPQSIPGQPRWRRRGCASTGWQGPPRIWSAVSTPSPRANCGGGPRACCGSAGMDWMS